MLENNPIARSISQWLNRNFSDPAALGLLFTLILVLLVVELFGRLLAPIFVSIALAYLLATPVHYLKRYHVPDLLAVLIVYLLFIGLVLWMILGLVPVLVKQLTNLVNEIPVIFAQTQQYISHLIQLYPHIFTGNALESGVSAFQVQLAKLGELALSFSFKSISGLITLVLYVIFVPILVFFFLKDGQKIGRWMANFLPGDCSLVKDVWSEVNQQIGHYIQGRVIEILLVSFVMSIAFSLLDLNYAILLGVAVGVSVLIPYVGVVLATMPIVIIALMQWGLGDRFFYTMVLYTLIIAFEANVLVPLLFAETMSLHPIAIILAVFIFGSIWGFWGVFLAIPLATLAHAVYRRFKKS